MPDTEMSDAPPAPESKIRRYCSYNYRDYADIVWFPPEDEDRNPTKADRDAAVQHAEGNGRLVGSDLMFGGYDQWRREYGEAHDAMRAEAEHKPSNTDNQEA